MGYFYYSIVLKIRFFMIFTNFFVSKMFINFSCFLVVKLDPSSFDFWNLLGVRRLNCTPSSTYFIILWLMVDSLNLARWLYIFNWSYFLLQILGENADVNCRTRRISIGITNCDDLIIGFKLLGALALKVYIQIWISSILNSEHDGCWRYTC